MGLWRTVVDNAFELCAGSPGEHPETSQAKGIAEAGCLC